MASEKARLRHKALPESTTAASARAASALPATYPAFLEDIKARIRTAQVKAALAANQELIRLYWSIGRDIVQRQRQEGWGKAVVERLALDIQKAFPGIEGFSATNVSRMRAFYLAWTGADSISAQAVPELENAKSAQAVPELRSQVLPQAAAEIPWGHNVVLLFKLQNPAERLWYAQQTVANGWSRAMLVHWIESDLYSRQGKAITNFHATLPPPQSDLAAQIVKDPYSFEFLTLRTDAEERELEHGLLDHIRRFLLELGAGFAFVGQQMHLEVGGEDYYLDLLFYHLKLRCYVVVDLKVQPFKPEFAGKMNFYLSAVDDLMRHPDDQPSIGLILCKTRSRVVAEYALRDMSKPIGVARYVTRLIESLPVSLRGSLPTVAQLEAELKGTSATRRRRR
jgi:predicted nuclease of restriction endonuclease-like (RecB) superfamily